MSLKKRSKKDLKNVTGPKAGCYIPYQSDEINSLVYILMNEE